MTALVPIDRLKKRVDFLRLRRGRRISTPSFLIQYAPNSTDKVRVGFTVTKKLGNAVVRNRIKRRLRAAVDEVFPTCADANTDYVLIARPKALTRPYARLLDDLRRALVDPSSLAPPHK
ncbi:MAG: ribonuclease P protein component [Pseudomonadota bacterium]